MPRPRFLRFAVVLLLTVGMSSPPISSASSPTVKVQKYDWKGASGYANRWAAPYGPGEGTATVANNAITVKAAPYTTAFDFSVFDHLKYIRTSTTSFDVPETGSVEFSVDLDVATPGTQPGRVIHGCYLSDPNEYWDGVAPCDRPYAEVASEGQQASVALNMINFETGQLFDWLVSGTEAMALIERLPTTVTGSPGTGLDKAYTQIIATTKIKPGQKHTYAIKYERGPGLSRVEYYLDHKLFTTVDHVGIPLDKQGVPFSGYAPSLGPGEQLSLDSFVIGHGLFSLLDAFPYQHPDAPELRVSIPVSERIFGQGAIATWKDFTVTTRH